MGTYFKSGQWNAICDRCGFEFKSGELRDEWTGLKVCNSCWEPRHPQTLIQSPPASGNIPWTRPEPPDVFIGFGTPLIIEDDVFDPGGYSTFITTETGAAILTEK